MPNITSTKKHLSATVYYLLTGLALGWPAVLSTGRLLPEWNHGLISSGLSLATIHLLVGSMLTVAFGVLYQIIPIAFQAPPIPRHVLYWHLPIHLVSVIIIVIGFLSMRFNVVGIGGSMLLCSAIAYFVWIAKSYIRSRNKTRVHKILSLPFAALCLVILFGIFQAFFTLHVHENVILTHVFIGGFAFWGGLIIVLSYKLVPMFSISHGYKASLNRSATTYYIGVVLSIASVWIPAEFSQTILSNIGRLLILIGLFSYTVDVFAIIQSRKRRKLVWPMITACVSMLFFVVSQAGIVLGAAFHKPHLFYASIYLFVFGGLIGLMLSYMQKIVPFLWFEYRFSKHADRKNAPPIDSMVPKWAAQFSMCLFFLGVVTGFAGIIAHNHSRLFVILDWGSAGSLTLGSVLLFGSLCYVLRIGGKRPSE